MSSQHLNKLATALTGPKPLVITDLTMDGTAQVIALNDATRTVILRNLGATTEGLRFAFGTSSANATAALTISAAAATTGIALPAPADGTGVIQVGRPGTATHIAVCNDTASDTQVCNVVECE